MKPVYPGGVPVQLEVEIESKMYENAAGERQNVLAGIKFALGAGEVGVFVGPSGCGKSTMLRILAGLDHNYQGRISHPAGARLGMVFQEPRLLPWRSVEENVRLAAPEVDEATRLLLCDAQTSGGMLVACDPARVSDLVRALGAEGTLAAAVVGALEEGAPGRIRVV